MCKYLVKSVGSMLNLGKRLARAFLVSEGVIYLEGELGVGKTTLVRGVLRGLGYTGKVKSPSFSLVERYATVPNLCHIDCYRINELTELMEFGIKDYLSAAWSFIEWPEKGEKLLPAPDLRIKILALNFSTRMIEWRAETDKGIKLAEVFLEKRVIKKVERGN